MSRAPSASASVSAAPPKATPTTAQLVREVALALRAMGKDVPRAWVDDVDVAEETRAETVVRRHRACAEVAAVVKREGYPHECTFATLLYPNAVEAGRLLEWLRFRSHTGALRRNGDRDATTSSAALPSKERQKPTTPQELEEARLLGGIAAARKAEADLRGRARRITSLVDSLEERVARLRHAVSAAEKSQQLIRADAAGNAAKLRELVASARTRLLDLVEEWEQHRVPLVEKYRHSAANKGAQSTALLRQREADVEAALARASIARAGDAQDEEEDALLAPEYRPNDGMDGDNDDDARHLIMTRVSDAMTQLRKQEIETVKLREEVREVEAELDAALDALERAEDAADAATYAASVSKVISATSSNSTSSALTASSTAEEALATLTLYDFLLRVRERVADLLGSEELALELDAENRRAARHVAEMRARVEAMAADGSEERVRQDVEALRAALAARAAHAQAQAAPPPTSL